MSFMNTWTYIQTNLQPGQGIDNWTRDGGYLGDQFTIRWITGNAVEVDTPGAQNIQRIPRDDFEQVYSLWIQYVSGRYPRHEIRDITRFSKYVISILRWVEQSNSGTLP